MSDTTGSTRSFEDLSGLEPLRAKSGRIIVLWIVYIVAGIIAVPTTSTVATAADIAEVTNAFRIKT